MTRVSISLSETTKSDVSEVRLDGIVDTTTSGELEETIESLLSRDRFRIIIDLGGVEYISSAGWGVLISRIRDVRNNKGDIVLAGMAPNVLEVYELLEFDNVLKHFDSLDKARAVFGIVAEKGNTKKKAPEISRLNVLESVSDNGFDPFATVVSAPAAQNNSAEAVLIRSIESDPFLTVRELVQQINNQTDTTRVGWWRVFKMLKEKKLLSRRSRFRLARAKHRHS